jgi:hypothetical protein
MNQPSAPSVFGTANILAQPLPLTLGEAVGVVLLLLLSVAANALQLYQRRVYIRTVYNELMGTFNSIGWLLVRCMGRTDELDSRVKVPDKYVAESTFFERSATTL